MDVRAGGGTDGNTGAATPGAGMAAGVPPAGARAGAALFEVPATVWEAAGGRAEGGKILLTSHDHDSISANAATRMEIPLRSMRNN